MAVIKKQNSYMGLPMNIARGNPVPLDTTEIWYNLDELKAYAQTGVTAYVGQIVQLVDEVEKTSTAYIIANVDGDLLEVGSATLGDNQSIELTSDGVLRLVGANNAQKGAQLVMGDNGVISWVMPDTTTVEGLNTAVAALDGRVDTVEEAIADHTDRIGDLEATLSGMGGIFNFAGSYTTDEITNLDKNKFQSGDVILVDGSKEYVLVEYEETVPDPDGEEGATKVVISKRWEVLGDPSGVTALEGRVETVENWKTSTSTTIANMETDISNAKTSITNLVNKDGEIDAALALKASKEELNVVDNKTATNAQAITGIQDDISTINTTLTTKADQTTVDSSLNDIRSTLNAKADKTVVADIVANYATKEELNQGLGAKVDTSSYNTQIALLTEADTKHTQDIVGVKATADKAKTDLEALTEVVGTKASAQSVTDLAGRVSKNESDISSHAQSISSLSGSITGLTNSKADKSTVEALDAEVKVNTKAINDHAADYTALEGRVTKAESDIAKAQADATQGINDAAEANTAAATAQAKGEEALAKANEVLGTAGDAADKNTVYGAKAAAAAAQETADAAQSEVDALEGVVSALDSAYKTADAGLNSRIEALESVIDGVQGAMHFIGVSSTDPLEKEIQINGEETVEIYKVTIDNKIHIGAKGDVVTYGSKEYVCVTEGFTIEETEIISSGIWVELGDVSAEAKRIKSLEDRMDTAEVATAKVPGIETEIGNIKTAAAVLEARVKSTEDINAAQAEAIAALEKRAGTIEKSIEDTTATLRQELAAKAAEINNTIAAQAIAHAEDIENLQSQINTINGQLAWHKMGE